MDDDILITPAENFEVDSKLYINRELSLLQFQNRVLEEAKDERNPLLERIKFLAIVGSNMDEFFMVRVGGLKMQMAAGMMERSFDGATPPEQLASIRKTATNLLNQQLVCLNSLIPKLKAKGIHILNYDELNKQQLSNAKSYFDEVIFPVLTPLAVDPGHPFPHISNLSLNLAVLVLGEDGKQHFARIKIPDTLPRLVPLKRSSGGVRKNGVVPHNHYFVWIEQVIAANLDRLFPGLKVLEAHPFYIVRNADMVIQELEAIDLLETIEQSVRQRRFGDVVFLGIQPKMPIPVRDILLYNLEMDLNDVYALNGHLGLSNLMELHAIDRYDLKDKPYYPAIPPIIQKRSPGNNIFEALCDGDILIHHPYDSFAPVLQFLKTAAIDPDVIAIKQTLYRVGKNSPVVNTLLDAQLNRKQVSVLVELKARFDEESNIGWAKKLEQEGVHVTYGLVGLKTHCKVALLVRREGEHIRRYIHLATGNYNVVTAHHYEDIGMFTDDDDIASDVSDLFNFISGYSAKKDYRKLLVAPINMRQRIKELILKEVENQRNGKKSHIILKVNAITDQDMIDLLYGASQAGVKIDLIVRGTCCLRPGLKNISENIRVISILGRFLEHSRIYYFENDGSPKIYLGSADMMPRNIDRRVEVLFPVEDPRLVEQISQEILPIYLADNSKAWIMKSNGSYERIKSNADQPPVSAQAWFINQRTSSR
ncbi:MAG: polyphosphate kinase 1 [Chloroflexota bacterium]